MKLLLDENLPKKLKQDFDAYEIYTVREMGWNGIKNGELLGLMIENHFDALLTLIRTYSFNKILKDIQSLFLYCLR